MKPILFLCLTAPFLLSQSNSTTQSAQSCPVAQQVYMWNSTTKSLRNAPSCLPRGWEIIPPGVGGCPAGYVPGAPVPPKNDICVGPRPASRPSEHRLKSADPASKEIRIEYALQLQSMLRSAVTKSGNDPTLHQVAVLADGEMRDDNERKLWEPANLEVSASFNLPNDVVPVLHNSAFNSRLYNIGYRGLQLINGRTTCNIHLTAKGAHPVWCDWTTSRAGVVTGKQTIHEWPLGFYVKDGQ